MNDLLLKRTNSADPTFKVLVNELDSHLNAQYGEMMETYSPHNIIEDNDTVVVAYLNGQPAGCGCFKPFNNQAVEVKRMFVREGFRGKGISKQVIAELESWALELGFTYTVLETGDLQTEALGLYPRVGYVQIDNYEPYVGLSGSICFRKDLVKS